MYDDIKKNFNNLIRIPEFQELLKDFRHRFGIPENGFSNQESEEYKNWITESLRKPDLLRTEFLFIAKRCKKLAPDKDPVLLTVLAYYFLHDELPNLEDNQDMILSTSPSGVLGRVDITFSVPLLFNLNQLLEEVESHKEEIAQLSENFQTVITNLNTSDDEEAEDIDSDEDFLPTTPGNPADIVDSIHRKLIYLAEFGRIALKEHLSRMRDGEFVISTYEDKNKPVAQSVQVGSFLLNRGLYPTAEEYWKQIDEEIVEFNSNTGKNVNRGIPLANQGVAQIAQGKVIEGLFNLYKGHQNDKDSLAHLPNVTINPERDLSQSVLFTQFEERQIHTLFNNIVQNFQSVFSAPITEQDLSGFVLNLPPDKKLLLFVTIYRFSFAYTLNTELTNPISRSEIMRALAELALWFEDELKRNDPALRGWTLVRILDTKIGQLNPTSGEFTDASSLAELETKITNAVNASGPLETANARIMGCIRNFAGHNLDVQDHRFFSISDEVFARMLSFIIYSNGQGWT